MRFPVGGRKAPGVRGVMASGVVAIAVIALTGAPARAEGPGDIDTTAATATRVLPEAQSGQIALPVHPREPVASPMPGRTGPPPPARSLDRFQICLEMGSVVPGGSLSQEDGGNGFHLGVEGAYYPYPRLAFGVGVTWSSFRGTAMPDITELGLFSRIHFTTGDGVSPYLRLAASFYENHSHGPRPVGGAPGSAGSAEDWTGGVGVGAGLGLQFRTGTPTGWFVEALIQNDFADPDRPYVYATLRGGLSLSFGGHRGVR